MQPEQISASLVGGGSGVHELRQPDTGVLSDPSMPSLERFAALAARLVGAPVALVSVSCGGEQRILARVARLGEPARTLQITPPYAYCQHVIEQQAPLIVADARRDRLLAVHPTLTDDSAISFAGFPLCTPDGKAFGCFCAIDDLPRDWSEAELSILNDLAAAVESQILLRSARAELQKSAVLEGHPGETLDDERTFLHALLESLDTGVAACDSTGRLTLFNEALRKLHGVDASSVGKDSWPQTYALYAEDGRTLLAADRVPLARALAGERVRGQRLVVHPAGQPARWFIANARPLDAPDGRRLGAVVAMHDVTRTHRAEILHRAQYAVAQAMAEATSAEQAVTGTVGAVAAGLDWICGEYWQIDDDRRGIHRQSHYQAPRWEATAFTGSQPTTTTLGGGLPGLVWARDAEIWASAGSLGMFTAGTAQAAWQSGIRTVIGVPVRAAGTMQGVLAFYADTELARDEGIAAMLDAVCAHLGKFVERRRAEDLVLALAAARRDFDRIIERVNDYVWTVEITADGTVRSLYTSPDGTGVFGGLLPTDMDMAGVLAERMDPDDRPAFAAFHADLCAAKPAEIECRILGYDGRTRWVWTRAVTRQEDGRLFADGICTNVTERHQLAEHQHAAAQAVQNSEQLLSAVAAVSRRTRTGQDARSTIMTALQQLAGADHVVLIEVARPAEDTYLTSQTYAPTDLIVTAAVGAAVVGTRIPLSKNSMTTRVYRSGQAEFLPDAGTDPRVAAGLLELSGACSLLWQPVIADGEVIAVLTVSWNQRLETLTDNRVRAVDLLADETAMALSHEALLHRLEQMALTDSLTGLANRRAWQSNLPRLLSQARRNGRPLTLAIADLDHFKHYNDSHGHPAGDDLLRRTATAFTDVLRDSDLLVRWGGEEFAIALADCSKTDAAIVLTRVRTAVPDAETCTIGYATWDGHETSEELLSRADVALYQAKDAGRNAIQASNQ